MKTPGKNTKPADARIEAIRRYSMTWLLQAACRVYERGMRRQDETRMRMYSTGLNGLFDLSDASTSGRFNRLPS